jgi:LPXTG-site transpeptidase (sortase) family protein
MKISNKTGFLVLLLCFFVFGRNVSGADFIFARNLSAGVRGDDVSALQQFLITGGFLKILTPTGYFGPLTKSALGAWQASAGISPSVGFFGPISRAKINGAQEKSVTETATSTTAFTNATTTIIANTMNGSPTRLKIPKLNIDAGFQYAGLKSDGSMEIPNNVVDVGWFTGSPRPGENGVSIITGHVAQIRGGVLTKPGVFSNLNKLGAGDKLYIQNDKGESITFAVRETRNYDPAADATDVFTSKDISAHLNIITCEGTWNPVQLSYTQRLVVFADLLKE